MIYEGQANAGRRLIIRLSETLDAIGDTQIGIGFYV